MTPELDRARSLLFVPGDRPDRFDRAAATGAVVILDLEDAVAPAARAGAREHVRRWLDGGGSALVRVQAAGMPDHGLDLDAVSGARGLLGVMLAKSERTEDVQAVLRRVAAPVVALVETAAGIAAARELARCASRLALGDQDLALDLGALPRSSLVRTLAAELVLASRLGGLPRPIDGVTPEIRAPELLATDARAGREGGFGGKLCIHPDQVPPVEKAFRPTAAEVAWARAVLASNDRDGGVTTANGAMIDRPLMARAEAVLRDASAGATDAGG